MVTVDRMGPQSLPLWIINVWLFARLLSTKGGRIICFGNELRNSFFISFSPSVALVQRPLRHWIKKLFSCFVWASWNLLFPHRNPFVCLLVGCSLSDSTRFFVFFVKSTSNARRFSNRDKQHSFNSCFAESGKRDPGIREAAGHKENSDWNIQRPENREKHFEVKRENFYLCLLNI